MSGYRTPVLLLLGALTASGAVAAQYTIELQGGTQFVTRYEPQQAPWDDQTLLLLTDVGNWVGLSRADIVSIAVDTDRKGFGKVIDTTTISLGWAPNEGAPEQRGEADPMGRYLDYLQSNQRDFSVEQFVEPSAAGAGGLPAFDVMMPGWGSIGLGGSAPPRAMPLPAPAPAPLASPDGVD